MSVSGLLGLLASQSVVAAPTGLTASASSPTQIDLAWTAVTHATGYKIERSLNGTTWATLSPSPALTGTSAAYSPVGFGLIDSASDIN
jgi:hypothetical protein